jgi:hypothetical protein
MYFKPLIPSALACLLAGCAAPMVSPDGPSMQSRVGYVKDWDKLAEQSAAHFVAQCQCDKRVVFVAPGRSDMPFGTAFRHLLEDKLRRSGARVAENALPATAVVRFEVQTFLYDHNGRPVPSEFLPVAEVLDEFASLYDTTRAEVLLTVSVSDGNYLSYRDPMEFYVQPADLAFYSGPDDGAHWINDNRAGAVRADWPASWDAPTGHPTLDAVVGPERRMTTIEN